ncbi:MAG: hypothetical protein GTN81_10500 [Proteobacteria bacterium]|nr:hypothetical protein [Pseudomonadota bacterium]
MTKNRTSGRVRYPVFIILLVIALIVGFFFLFRSRYEKRIETQRVEQEAVKRIEALTEGPKEPIDLEQADSFVSPETALSKKDRQTITTTPKALLEDQTIGAESEIKVLVEEEKTIITTPRELMKNRTIHPDAPLRIIREDGKVEETTTRELLADQSITPDTPIKIILTEEKVVVTTPSELQKTVSSLETPVKVVVEKPSEIVTVGQLLPGEETTEGDTFYIHAVTRQDVQGIWGIIQHGLMDQFLKGIPVSGEDPSEKQILTLEIPELADEPGPDGYSSYLGKVLAEKTGESYVYNHTSGRMGKNPDYIAPGQELVISRFSREELVEIYKHYRLSR